MIKRTLTILLSIIATNVFATNAHNSSIAEISISDDRNSDGYIYKEVVAEARWE